MVATSYEHHLILQYMLPPDYGPCAALMLECATHNVINYNLRNSHAREMQHFAVLAMFVLRDEVQLGLFSCGKCRTPMKVVNNTFTVSMDSRCTTCLWWNYRYICQYAHYRELLESDMKIEQSKYFIHVSYEEYSSTVSKSHLYWNRN